MPASLPSRSHTATLVTRLARSSGKHLDDRKEDAYRTSYAAITAAPTHHTSTAHPSPPTDNTQAPPPAQQPKLPTIVGQRLPNWVGHFRTIAEALGHAPNARAYKKGAKFEPKSKEELRTIRRCLEEAAASDSAISYYEIPEDTATEEQKTPPTQHTTTPQGATQLPAAAELGDDAPPRPLRLCPPPRTRHKPEPTPRRVQARSSGGTGANARRAPPSTQP